ncbi:MAG: hypothetical protein OXE83_04680 [Gammaproteobacteria bacterium]|nr:hypothetical protein [Gammaproteobacteria bacterium]
MAMTAKGGMEERKVLAGMLQATAGHLSRTHVAALVAHPHAVRSALAAAADILTVGDREPHGVETIAGVAPTVVDLSEASRRLSARSRNSAPDGVAPESLLSSDELAARAGLKTRQSVHEWRKKGKIIGWQNARRGYVFPAGQLDGRNRPLQGLAHVAALFDDGYAAWVWLTTPLPSLEGALPLALLAEGQIQTVANAAKGDLQGDFG